MATLWWLGYTANGDCNQAANWTYYGPGSSGYAFGIQPSANIPKYNDTVIFDRISFTTLLGETGTYPIYPPIGDMRGLCGPAGNTAAQWFAEVLVRTACPVAIGGSTAFSFRTTSLTIQKGVTAGTPSGSSSKINLVDCAGVTKLNATIKLDSVKLHNYYFTGIARKLEIKPLTSLAAGVTSAFRDPYSNIYLYGMDLQGSTFNNADVVAEELQNAALVANEPFISSTNAALAAAAGGLHTPQVNLYVNSTSTFGKSIFLLGREKLNIDRGFSLNDINLNMGAVSSSSEPNSYSIVEFNADAAQSATGPDTLTRSTLSRINMYGNNTWDDYSYSLLPRLIFRHGTTITQLYLYGTGSVFSSAIDGAIVSRGVYVPARATSSSVNNENANTQLGISDFDYSSTWGPAGYFIYDNTDFDVNTPLRMNFGGTWRFSLVPLDFMPTTL
jgi:hypothetical protein